jgi:sporadic carbohydrate cluster protein (TIGR04323 family)
MKNSKIQLRGYIFAREIENNIISHKVQNLVIRDFCKNNDFSFLLSSVEYKMKNSFLILEDIIKELPKINGIVMFSMFQLPLKDEERKKIYKKIFNKKKYLCFALENIIISNYREIDDFDRVFKLNKLLKYCPKEISNEF